MRVLHFLQFLQFLTDAFAVFTSFAVFAFLKLFLSLTAKSQNHFSAISSHNFVFILDFISWTYLKNLEAIIPCVISMMPSKEDVRKFGKALLAFACISFWINTFFIHCISILIIWPPGLGNPNSTEIIFHFFLRYTISQEQFDSCHILSNHIWCNRSQTT